MARRRKTNRIGAIVAGCTLATAMLASGATWVAVLIGWLPGRPAHPLTPTTVDPFAAPLTYAWSEQPEPQFPIPPYSRFLEGVRIVLDPGHVGQRERPGFKVGPTGLREAEANLRVALRLREFLQAVSADVMMTREVDRSLNMDDDDDLKQRAEFANQARADLLLSIHHNAGPSDANFTTVFYHADGSDSPASVCAARHLLTGINDALRLERHIDCALWSDHQIYPPPKNDGFALLRLSRGPAVLCESSFHSNPQEEARLRDPVYNRREAYGMFLGLARWAQAGLPRALPRSCELNKRDRTRTLTVQLDDGLSRRGGKPQALKLLSGTLRAELDGKSLPTSLNTATGELRVTLPANMRTGGLLFVDFENIFGAHVLHPWIEPEL